MSQEQPQMDAASWARLAREGVKAAVHYRSLSAGRIVGPVDLFYYRARMRAWAVNAVRFARKSGQPISSVWRAPESQTA